MTQMHSRRMSLDREKFLTELAGTLSWGGLFWVYGEPFSRWTPLWEKVLISLMADAFLMVFPVGIGLLVWYWIRELPLPKDEMVPLMSLFWETAYRIRWLILGRIWLAVSLILW